MMKKYLAFLRKILFFKGKFQSVLFLQKGFFHFPS